MKRGEEDMCDDARWFDDAEVAKEAIRDSIRYCEEEEGRVRRLEFLFTAPRGADGGAISNPAVLEVVELFRRMGYEPDVGDTVMSSFDLNRNWWWVTCDRCVRDYAYALPIDDDLDALARIVQLEGSGQVEFVVLDR